jgi:hypothetical protein
MKNILILANGAIAKHFIEWIGRKRVAENNYFVLSYHRDSLPDNIGNNIDVLDADPTSYARVSSMMNQHIFSDVFIVMDDKQDAIYALKNVRMCDDKIRIVFVNQWDDEEITKDEDNITVLNEDEIIAAHLYDNLPNVPLVAQNVGLGKGDIMEIRVPYGSTYAFRHIGSILQRKWQISAIYRNEQLILPTNAIMIKPNDTLLVIGKPTVLDGVYRSINRRVGLFPEPFGKNLYLLIDMRKDLKDIIEYVDESIFLLEKLKDVSLHIRVIYPSDFILLEKIKSYNDDNRIRVHISYDNDSDDIISALEYDIQEYDIGLILSGVDTFKSKRVQKILFELKKAVYIFGDTKLSNLKECVVLMDGEEERMEAISSTAFDVSESLDLGLCLCDFDPDGDFENKKIIIEHYENLSQIFNTKITVQQKIANPIREIQKMDNLIHIIPFEEEIKDRAWHKLISTQIKDFFFSIPKHPKLLVPFTPNEL